MPETIMAKMTQEQMQADWTATKNIVGIQALLDGETDDGRYSILSQLIAEEFKQFKEPQAEAPRSAGINPNRVIEDVGNPLMGIFIGALMIAATMSGFFLWDNYQSGADAKATVQIDRE
jgi:hypothetical protein